MRIRPARPADIPFMMELAAASSGAAQWTRADYERIFFSSEPGSQSSAATRRHCLLAENAENAENEDKNSAARGLGFVVARALGAEWEIENMAVAPQARRQGIGARLLAEALALAARAHAQAVFLEVRESNRAARSLYERGGFTLLHRRRGYYQQPHEDALVYRLSFPQASGENRKS